jgi:carotenoid cleavage dioxygenase
MAIDADPVVNPYLSGNFAPVHDELDVDQLEVTGTIPEALEGVYLRNGANPAFDPITRYHLFDGDGMIHAVDLRGGTARYRNKYVVSKALAYERELGHAVYGGLGQFVMPDPVALERGGLYKNTANTNIVRHAGTYLALMEGAHPTELTAQLDTVGEYNFGGDLHGSMTAHPKWDPATGQLLFFGYSPVAPYLRYHEVDPSGALTRSIDIDLPGPVMMHDFVVTERNVVFFDLPAVFDLDAMLSGGTGIRWEPSAGARIGVMPRDAGVDGICWIEVDPFFVFHFLNAWDTGDDTVVVDGCRASRMPTAFGDDVLDEAIMPNLYRWTIDTAAGTVHTQQLDDRPGDFPRINAGVAGTPNRYGYLAKAAEWEDAVQFSGFVKYDLTTGTAQDHDYGGRCEAGEPVFAPDPDGTAEDDGWVLNFVFDRDTQRSEFHIVDARDAEGEPVARVHLPRRVPFGFHGNWLPDTGTLPTY